MPQRIRTFWADLTPGAVCRALIPCTALAGYLFIIAVSGADMARFVSFYLCAAVYLVLPGFALADWLGPHETGLRVPLAMLYGIALLAGVHCLAVYLGALWLLYALPAGVTLGWVLQKLRARRAAGLPLCPQLPSLPKNALALWAVLCLLFALMFSAVNPHPLAAGAVDLARDMLWNVGNTTALSRHFPPYDIRFAGVRLSYHYLTELLLAALHLLSGASSYDCNAYFAGPLFLAGELAALRAFSQSYFGPQRPRATRLTGVLLFGFQSLAMWKVSAAGNDIFGNTTLKHLITNINAQATALVLSCIFLLLFLRAGRRGFAVGGGHLAALLLAFALLCVAKGPQAAILVCSLAVTMGFVLLFQKPQRARALVCLLGCLGLFAASYVLLFAGGAGSSMELSTRVLEGTYAYRYLLPWADRLQVLLPFSLRPLLLVLAGVLNAFCMAPFQFLLWLTALPAALRRLPRLDPACMLAHGAVVGGFLAYHIFYHTSSSQVYFALTAILMLAPLAADRLDILLREKPLAARKWPLWLAGAAAALTTACILCICAGNAVRQLRATLGAGPALATERRCAPEDEAAMRWLDANTGPDVVFATNRIDSSAVLDDGISNVYSAFGSRQGYMEGWKYAYTNMGLDPAVIEHRLEVDRALFDAATAPDTVWALCAAEGIDCLVWAKAWPGQVNPALAPAYENAEVAIYLVPTGA